MADELPSGAVITGRSAPMTSERYFTDENYKTTMAQLADPENRILAGAVHTLGSVVERQWEERKKFIITAAALAVGGYAAYRIFIK